MRKASHLDAPERAHDDGEDVRVPEDLQEAMARPETAVADHVPADPATGEAAAALPEDGDVRLPLATEESRRPVSTRPPDAGSSPHDEAVSAELRAIIEALIFASPEPLTPKALKKLLEGESSEAVESTLAALRADYNDQARGLQLIEVAGGYQIVTRPELHDWVRRLFHERTTQKLSVQALETLAVIAYKQPVTAAEITEIRSVNSAGVLGTLVDRRLVKIAGRKPVVGRPFMYATTREFLDRFGLRDLSELPKIEDMADALGFEPPVFQDAGAEAALPFDGDALADRAADRGEE
jgi:segregation and condensation protein B